MKYSTILINALSLLTVVSANTPDNKCGPTGGNQICNQDGGPLVCCSKYGNCGMTTEYCSSSLGCQSAFGSCTLPQPTLPRPQLGSVPYGSGIPGCSVPGTIALTFDDGPYLYTNDLLDLLKRKNVKATFFIAGNNINKGAIDATSKWRTVIKRAYNEGHQIASHTWDHVDLSLLSETDRREEMTRNERAFLSILGRYPTYMRPPFISCNDACLATMVPLGYHVIIWDLNTQDYKNDNPTDIQKSKDIVKNYLEGTNPLSDKFDSISHDVHFQTVFNLTEYQIDLNIASGYRHVTLGECLNDPKANWYRTQF